MRNLVFAIIALVLTGTDAFGQDNNGMTTFILVRHAEKSMETSPDPGLTTAGLDRAQRLASLLKNTSIDAIYSTRFNRTKSTVEPIANAKKLAITAYNPSPESMLSIMEANRGKTVLVCGHSNTTPELANLLTGTTQFKPYQDHEYGIILIVTVSETGKVAQVTRIDY